MLREAFTDVEQRRRVMWAFGATFVGGVVGYNAWRSAREGDLFKVEAVGKARPDTDTEAALAFIGAHIVILFTGKMLYDGAQEAGWV